MVSGLMRRLSDSRPDTSVTTQASWSGLELTELVSAGRLDFAIVGVCGDAAPPPGLEWRQVAVDVVGVLLAADHPLAGQDEVDLAHFADARWAATPGVGCFAECFAAACARAGFAPEPMYETDLRVCLDLVTGGQAVALCQPTFREQPDVRGRPFAGAPLLWRHFVGWDPDAPADAVAAEVHEFARAAYRDSLRHSPSYASWLDRHPGYGA